MPRGVFNWTFQDIVRFLRARGFTLGHIEGSHYFYVAMIAGRNRQVCVPFHGRSAIHPRTLRGIIAQSGLTKEEWLRHS